MSKALVSAMGLLCRLLEQDKPQVNGAALLGGEYGHGGRELIHERLLIIGSSLTYVSCPDCGIELARVVRSLSADQVLLYCDECGEVNASTEITKTYTVSLSKFMDRLATSLEFESGSRKVIDLDVSWRLGVQEHKHRKAQTWYFARHLFDPAVAKHLVDQISADRASQSAKILTSSDVPLPDGSPLASYDIVNLSATARLSQSRFLFFDHRVEPGLSPTADETPSQTTLRFVRDKSLAYVDGVKYELEGMQQKILLALIESRAHRLERNDIAERCGVDAENFKPAKYFGRKPQVYRAFINYDRGDAIYELIVHPEDKNWL